MLLTEDPTPSGLPRPWEERSLPRPKTRRGRENVQSHNFSLEPSMIAWLEERARREGRSRSDVLRRVIAEAMRTEKRKEARHRKEEEDA